MLAGDGGRYPSFHMGDGSEKSLWDVDPEDSSLPMISSSAIELVHEDPRKDPIIEDPAEASFFEVSNSAQTEAALSSSSLSDPLVLADAPPRRSSRALPWLLFILSITGMVAAWLELVKPRFETLAQTQAKLTSTARELGSRQTEVETLKTQLSAVEADKAALTTERDQLQAEHDALAATQKERDDLAERLRTAFAGEKRVEVAMVDDAVALRMTTDDLFVFGDVTLKDPALLDLVGGVLKGQGEHRITIAGHTDSTPVPSKLKSRFPSNYELAMARALAVYHQLEPLNLSQRMRVATASANEPIASNKTQQGRQRNRRIEILVR